MAGLQPALSWDFLHRVNESPAKLQVFPDIIHPLLSILASHSRTLNMHVLVQVTILTCGLSVLVYLSFLLYLHLVKLGPFNITR